MSTGRAVSGFVLLEVLVSVAILATGITVALECISNSVSNATLMEEYTRAVMLADARMNELQRKLMFKTAEEVGDLRGDYDEEFEGYTYEVEIEEESVRDMIVIRVAVSFPWREKGKTYVLMSQVPMARPLEED